MRVLHGHNVRTCLIRYRRGDDVACWVFDGGRTRVVWQAKHFGWIGFQPLFDAFGREAGQFSQPPFAICKLGEYLDPALGNGAILKPQPTFGKCGVSLLEKIPEGKLRSTIPSATRTIVPGFNISKSAAA